MLARVRVRITSMRLAPFALLALTCACSSSPPYAEVPLPDGEVGIGFGDLRFSHTLDKVLAPAGRSGRLDLVDVATLEVTSIEGFGGDSAFDGTSIVGATTADEGDGWVFAADHTRGVIAIVDPRLGAIVGTTPLAAPAEIVRFVPSTHELWVTEPSAQKIEI